ncbi:MAG: hypothetical protein M3680_16490 [Myxococcota bacterium]|nr:hypothetical protein [Myxococcota bacterium]
MRELPALLADLEAFHPPLADDVDWSPLRELLDELFAHEDLLLPAIALLLQLLERFHAYPAFACFWPLVHGIERQPGYESALVEALRTAPTSTGVTLLLRVLADGIDVVDGVAIAPLAAALMEG